MELVISGIIIGILVSIIVMVVSVYVECRFHPIQRGKQRLISHATPPPQFVGEEEWKVAQAEAAFGIKEQEHQEDLV